MWPLKRRPEAKGFDYPTVLLRNWFFVIEPSLSEDLIGSSKSGRNGTIDRSIPPRACVLSRKVQRPFDGSCQHGGGSRSTYSHIAVRATSEWVIEPVVRE